MYNYLYHGPTLFPVYLCIFNNKREKLIFLTIPNLYLNNYKAYT